jgi:hypothetical protein
MHCTSFGEYTDALQPGLDRALADPSLRNGTLRTLGPGQPLVRGGKFALTFEVAAGAGRYALRCFHKELDSLELRYTAIEQHLARIDSPCFVPLSFQPQGITTESGTIPIVRMDWAEGPSLSAFVAEHRRGPGTLRQLRESLRHLAVHLHAIGVAHGDTQPSNVIVQRDGALRLIDYDGLFVPGLEAFAGAELGQRNFQHPGRRSWHFDGGLDAFSFAVLDFALDALGTRPELWQPTRSGEDAFLLQAADFLAGRGIPTTTVPLAAADGPRGRPAYLSSNPVVNGADFAQCCRHVGDRVEVVGRVVDVVEEASSTPGTTCLRVEFGEPELDTVSLRVWPEALPEVADASPDPWAGQWLNAVGLVELVSSGPAGGQRRSHVSISITEQSQLLQLPEAETRHRLDSQIEWSGRFDGAKVGVRTEPAPAEAEPTPDPGDVEPASIWVEPEPPPRPAARSATLSPPEPPSTVTAPTPTPETDEVPAVPVIPVAARSPRRQHWWPGTCGSNLPRTAPASRSASATNPSSATCARKSSNSRIGPSTRIARSSPGLRAAATRRTPATCAGRSGSSCTPTQHRPCVACPACGLPPARP